MKQILQNLKTGTIELAEVPAPHLKQGHILVETRTSLISAGTERMLLECGKVHLTDFCLDHFSVMFHLCVFFTHFRLRQIWVKNIPNFAQVLTAIIVAGLPAISMAGSFV